MRTARAMGWAAEADTTLGLRERSLGLDYGGGTRLMNRMTSSDGCTTHFAVAIVLPFSLRRLFLMLWHFPLDSKGRQKKLNEVGYVDGIYSACLLIRCIMVAISECDVDADIDVLDHSILNFIYYMLVEILPSARCSSSCRSYPASEFHTAFTQFTKCCVSL